MRVDVPKRAGQRSEPPHSQPGPGVGPHQLPGGRERLQQCGDRQWQGQGAHILLGYTAGDAAAEGER